MTIYRDVALIPAGPRCFVFSIGSDEYIADSIPEAQAIVDEALDGTAMAA